MNAVPQHGALVLLVEDDRAGREMLALGLEQAGFRVEQAHNGLQALDKAFEIAPDAIVTDLAIPGIDGLQLCRRLRDDPRTRGIPIIGITGFASFSAEPERATRAGCDAVFLKPCLSETLINELHRLLATARRA
ncbi:MAG TPA: response regulator [Vicinamibacterales bacterium]|nr:response regulator [Vicinamibacterales bacterium]